VLVLRRYATAHSTHETTRTCLDEAVVEVKPEQRRIGRGILVDGLGDDPADDRLGVRARVLVEPDPELRSIAIAISMGG